MELDDLRKKIIAENLTVPVDSVIQALKDDKAGFDLDLTLEELWEQEKPYFKEFGMTAFSAGYRGKSLKCTHEEMKLVSCGGDAESGPITIFRCKRCGKTFTHFGM